MKPISSAAVVGALLGALCAGGALAQLAWMQGHSLGMLLLVPVGWALFKRHSHAFTFMLGYYVATTWPIAAGAGNFSHGTDHHLVLLAGWLACCTLAATPWWLAHMGFDRGGSVGAAAFAAMQLLLLYTPLLLINIAPPLLGWGSVLGGLGEFGILAGIGLWGLAIVSARRIPTSRAAASAAVALCAAFVLSIRDEPQLKLGPQIYAASVRWDEPGRHGADEVIDRIAKIGSAVRRVSQVQPDIRTVVWPEGVLGDLLGRINAPFAVEVGSASRDLDMQVLVGVDELLPSGERRVGALIQNPDGSQVVRYARQPMPVSLWRPWRQATYSADWSRDATFDLRSGGVGMLSFCWEDLLPGLHIAALRRRSDTTVIVSIANDWWMADDSGALRQGKAIEAVAKLYGLPLVRAVNLPAPR